MFLSNTSNLFVAWLKQYRVPLFVVLAQIFFCASWYTSQALFSVELVAGLKQLKCSNLSDPFFNRFTPPNQVEIHRSFCSSLKRPVIKLLLMECSSEGSCVNCV